MSETIVKNIKNNTENILDVVKERVFSPMYFYFIIAWIISNWKFVYTLFFIDDQYIKIPKVEYLANFYKVSSSIDFYFNFLHLFIIPAVSTFVAVWWLSKLSEKFYGKNEKHKLNQVSIKKQLVYTAQVEEYTWRKKIRDLESDKNKIKYEDNESFNDYYDQNNEEIILSGIHFKPSEVLYNNDYEAYKEELSDSKWIPF